MNPFELLLTQPILNILVAFYKLLESLSVPGALGFAIILLTVVIRMVVWPLTTAQLKSAQKMAALKPHLDRIKQEHGHDKVKHQQEQARLYKENGVNPISGCFLALIQLPVFIALYNILFKIIGVNSVEALAKINEKLYFPSLHLNNIPSADFFGINLAVSPKQWQEIGFLILLVPVLTGLFQLAQSQMMIPLKPKENKQKAVVKKDQKANPEDIATQMQTQMAFISPLLFAFISYSLPIGLAIYWNIFTILSIIQQYVITGAGSLNRYLPEKLRK